MFKKLLTAILARRLTQHASFATMAIGMLCSLLGIPLAPEQISLLITAFSIVSYIATQLWRDAHGISGNAK